MKRLFWIGSPFFSGSLAACGWEVRIHNFEHTAVFGWNDIVAIAGWEPDIVVVADKSRPPFVLGMEDFPCLTVFYSVDSHIHSWHPLYAQGFDVCIMSLRDHMSRMAGEYLKQERVWWSPAFAKDDDLPGAYNPKWDVLFVGTVNAQTMPKRHTFMSQLQQRLPNVQVMQGDYRKLYPQARLVLNYCEFGDLNFRVFEALGCGACLITPDIGHGQSTLFTDGKDLLTYPADKPDAIDILERKITHALSNEQMCRTIAGNGLSAINSGHRAIHRATDFSNRIRLIPASECIKKRMHNAPAIRSAALKLIYLLLADSVENQTLKKAYLAAASGTF